MQSMSAASRKICCESRAACEWQLKSCIVAEGDGDVRCIRRQRAHLHRLRQQGISDRRFRLGNAILYAGLEIFPLGKSICTGW